MVMVKKIVVFLSFLSLSLAQIPRDDFYHFGMSAGDTAIPPNDDGSSGQITLQSGSFPYFGEQHTTLYVNNNGVISFAGPVSTFTPSSFPLQGFSLIAPYWADVDTRGTGAVYYRETQDNDILRRASNDIMISFSIRFLPTFVFIATWDRVGHFNTHTERIATFQCVLMTDGNVSYVKFLYANGEIQWTTGDASGGVDGFGGTPAQVGFDAGDRERFFSVPGSQTNEIVNITTTSNVNIPGVWAFRVNGELASCSSPEDIENTPLVITPRTGNIFGGTAISISSMCLKLSDTITCIFQESAIVSADIVEPNTDNEAISAVCISPLFPVPGSKRLNIVVVSESGETKYNTITQFYARSIEEIIAVRVIDQLSPLIPPQTLVTVSWDRQSFLPAQILDPNSFRVLIVLVLFDTATGNWEEVSGGIVNPSRGNTGEATVEIVPLMVDQMSVQPVAIQVRIDTGNNSRRKRVPTFFLLLDGIIQWSTILYYTPSSSSRDLRQICDEWYDSEPDPFIGEIILEELEFFVPCAPTVEQASFPNTGLVEDVHLNLSLFHNGVSVCFRSEIPSPSGYGQQCCYDSNGFLVVGNPGGSVDRVSPLLDMFGHIREDVIPYTFCCLGELSNCNLYYDRRPSDIGRSFDPNAPGGIFGDPHIVTLDGFEYTFNGRGEYLLAQVDNEFMFQGRMTQPSIPAGNTINATVFSAIAMREGNNTVQFQVGPFEGDPEALRNGEFIDFTVITFQQFDGVTVRKVNNMLSASFANGAYIEAREENGFFSTLLVSLPESWQGRTEGLMGNYNGNTSDDLTPQTGDPLPLDSDLRTIHESFGVTWIISDQQDSIFSYANGENFTIYYFPDFEPSFDVTFSDPALEQAANEICGDDFACRFDIATTGDTTIGLTTLMGGQEFDLIVNNSQPTVCDPPCVNGACVLTDVCSCSVGYTGPQCDTAIITECEIDPCENGGNCTNLAGSIICSCPPGFGGSSCTVDCSRSVECTVDGTLMGQRVVKVTGREMKCVIRTGIESSFVRDDPLLTLNEYLAPSSNQYLSSLLNALSSEDIETITSHDCTVPEGIQNIEYITIKYTRDDGTVATERLRADSIDPESLDVGEMNQSALVNLVQWLATQPSPLPSPQCKLGGCTRHTDIFFTLPCPV